ncbi:MAG TPA: 4-hydroxy-3-methylbut-2-en-1-yl diphosphate synthase [Crocinitomicaceae bacterium]|nr:4-hydroxy-3-methylbut-2-en-1-yl diphosphate synthase [Crocinitomicaceae bacterium]
MDKKTVSTTYCQNYFKRSRFKTRAINIGNVVIGGNNSIAIQSMTTVDTMDTQGSIDESIRMIDAGCEIVRLTAPSKKDAENLRNIKNGLIKLGYHTPLVADIHFTPNAAEVAAGIVAKVRVNPGNYADKKKFEEHNYTDDSYSEELERIEKKFTPLVLLCKQNKVAMRIGTNHGSLSDRILSRFGDTPEGMVESAMEFLRICIKHNYHSIALSMKASNTLVMVEAYRLLVATMKENGMNYPLHLGVTEAGDGEDGRIKSAVGIGALLEDGIGDTIRVSLTEKPEAEMPVAEKLLAKFDVSNLNEFEIDDSEIELPYDPFHYSRRETTDVLNIGDHHVPVVFADLSSVENIKPSHFFGFGLNYSVNLDKWNLSDAAADYVFIGEQKINFELPGTIRIVCSYENWKENYVNKKGFFPLVAKDDMTELTNDQLFFVKHSAEDLNVAFLENYPTGVVILESDFTNKTQLYRAFSAALANHSIKNPVILSDSPKTEDGETFQLWSSSNLGSLFIDGFGDGIWLKGGFPAQLINSTSFGILQATRRRISKTEYISCPSCGRTLFDLQETTAKIRAKTSHLKGLKIGIMGCIVNGPGEMADADYGYVGTGVGKIHLYKEQNVVRKNVPEAEAVDALIELIRENGDWVDRK